MIRGVILVLDDRYFNPTILVSECAPWHQPLLAEFSRGLSWASKKLSWELLNGFQLLIDLKSLIWHTRISLSFRDLPPIGEHIRPRAKNVLH